MKQLCVSVILFFICAPLFSQHLKLTLSNPQPRLGQDFDISLNITEIKEDIFKSLNTDDNLSLDFLHRITDGAMRYTVKAKKLGTSTVGPLQFAFNGKTYTTKTVAYEVIDALPDSAKGLWFRKVPVNDTTFFILIDQRIPAQNKTTDSTANSWSKTLVAAYKDVEFINYPCQFYPAAGFLDCSTQGSRSDFGYARNNAGLRINCQTSFHSATFTIRKNGHATITKAFFKNIPEDYKFEDINIP